MTIEIKYATGPTFNRPITSARVVDLNSSTICQKCGYAGAPRWSNEFTYLKDICHQCWFRWRTSSICRAFIYDTAYNVDGDQYFSDLYIRAFNMWVIGEL